jgi:glycosyltransferase involved in cell wall biosynthesis
MHSNKNIRILFVYPYLSSFIEHDLNVLKNYFNVDSYHVKTIYSLKIMLDLFKKINSCDMCFIWFADSHATLTVLISKLLNKKTVLVVGGFEVANNPEIKYGLLRNLFSSLRVKYALNKSSIILAVSEFSRQEIAQNTTNANLFLIYNGVDVELFKYSDSKENLVVTIGNSYKKSCVLKGIETFVKSSNELKDLNFVIIGSYDEKTVTYLNKLSNNISFTGPLPQEEIITWLQKARVYCQLSYRESFGMALVESMSCGCIPVVTDRGAIPEVVGNTGYYVPYNDYKETVRCIRESLLCDNGLLARNRVSAQFSMKIRETKLIKVINDLFDG